MVIFAWNASVQTCNTFNATLEGETSPRDRYEWAVKAARHINHGMVALQSERRWNSPDSLAHIRANFAPYLVS